MFDGLKAIYSKLRNFTQFSKKRYYKAKIQDFENIFMLLKFTLRPLCVGVVS